MRSTCSLSATPALALVSLALVAACGGTDTERSSGQPAREIQLAPAPMAEPQLKDAPAPKASAPAKAPPKAPARAPLQVERAPAPAPQPVVPAPAPAVAEAPAPEPTGTVSAGTAFAVRPVARVCTSTHKAGDRFTTTLDQTLEGSNGASIPAGSTVVLRVVESARSEDSKNDVRLTFDVVSVKMGDETYAVDARVTQSVPLEKVRAQSTGEQAGKVGKGAAIGAIVGQILGKNTRSTVTGAVVGAAAGAAVAAGTADYDGCLPANAAITITLERPLKVKVKSSE